MGSEMENWICDKIKQADLVLVGIGEEFSDLKHAPEKKAYQEIRESLMASGNAWMLPALNSFWSGGNDSRAYQGLCMLAERLSDKNYFVVSVAVNEAVALVPWKEHRLTTPCGSENKKQCSGGCSDVLPEVTEKDKDTLTQYFEEWKQAADKAKEFPKWIEGSLGVCPHCGKPFILNNIYAQNYNENGYLESWQRYTKWLQGTLNRNLLILELGVGMQFPSVIRWPFEKIAFFQKKSELYRVNEKLYQLSEELGGKAYSISKNAIDWLLHL